MASGNHIGSVTFPAAHGSVWRLQNQDRMGAQEGGAEACRMWAAKQKTGLLHWPGRPGRLQRWPEVGGNPPVPSILCYYFWVFLKQPQHTYALEQVILLVTNVTVDDGTNL